MRLLSIAWLCLIVLVAPARAEVQAASPSLPPVKVYAPKVCLACLEWAEHLRQNGFTVSVDNSQDMAAIKKRYRIIADWEARHTATVGPYFIEGHVPAADIKLLLQEKPQARGLVVPGAPRGAPGLDVLAGTGCETGCTMLEGEGAERIVRRELFNTLLVDKHGETSVYARH
jgi:hypothetical protein